MAIGDRITGALTSLFGGKEEEDAVSAAPLSVMAASPRAAPEGTVDYGGLKQLLQQQLIQEQTERLRESRSSRADEFLAFASGLGRPTKTGSFGESLGYANEALARQSAESAKLRAAQRKIMLEYGVDIATLGIEEQKGRLDAQAKTAAAPRPVTAEDIARFGKSISADTHIMVDGKPVLIPMAEEDAVRMTDEELANWKLPPGSVYVLKNNVPTPVREGRGLNADQTLRLGYAQQLFGGLTEQEILDQGLLYSPDVDARLIKLYGSKAGAGAFASAAAREPFEEPLTLVNTQIVNGITYYKMSDGRLYDNPSGKR